MADKTKIEWTEATWNPITGCSIASPGCTNCYAMQLAGTRLKHHPSREGLTRMSGERPKWTGEVRFNEQWITQPLKWTRPRMVFVCAHGDLFHGSVPDEWIDCVFAVMALAPNHTFQVLTKRAGRMRDYLNDPMTPVRIASVILDRDSDWGIKGRDALAPLGNRAHENDPSFVRWPLLNVWPGVSVEDQERADERIPQLLETPAAVRWLSCEPLLGPLNLARLSIQTRPGDEPCGLAGLDALSGMHWDAEDTITGVYGNPDPRIDWVVVGGESGRNARPMHPDWVRNLRDQCAEAGTAFFFKQWGAWELAIDRERDDPDWRADYSNKFSDTGDTRWLNLAGGCGFHGERFVVMRKATKAAAGRLLDGAEHSGMPGAAK